MSYDIQPFNPKTSKPREGMRLAKCSYKTPKNGGPKKDSKCVSVPFFKIDGDQVVRIQSHINNWIEGIQDNLIRDRIEEGAVLITASDISFDKIAEFLEADARGDRLTSDAVKVWFDESLADTLTVALADKFKISDSPSDAETKKLTQAITVYRDKFASMAGGRTQFSAEVATKLRKVLELATDGEITSRFGIRLDKMMQSDSDILESL